MPDTTTVFVCKNNLMKVAVAEKTNWAVLADKGCTVRLLPYSIAMGRMGEAVICVRFLLTRALLQFGIF